MSEQTSKEIRSTVTSEGNIEISIATIQKPTPSEHRPFFCMQLKFGR